jgi:hypothetical protein
MQQENSFCHQITKADDKLRDGAAYQEALLPTQKYQCGTGVDATLPGGAGIPAVH